MHVDDDTVGTVQGSAAALASPFKIGYYFYDPAKAVAHHASYLRAAVGLCIVDLYVDEPAICIVVIMPGSGALSSGNVYLHQSTGSILVSGCGIGALGHLQLKLLFAGAEYCAQEQAVGE